MRRIHLICAMCVVAVAAAAAPIGAQDAALPTIDQVLDKYISAVGGRAAIEKISSIQARGSVEIADLSIAGTIEASQKTPNKSLQVIDLSGVGVTREGFDGTVGWTEDPQNGVREKAGVELAEARRMAMFPRELTFKQQYATLTVTGRETVGSREAVVVIAKPAEGEPARMYFDAESGLLLRHVANRATTQGPVQVDVMLDDYRPIDGVKRPHLIRQVTPQFTAVVKFTEFKHNVAIDDAVFKKPGIF